MDKIFLPKITSPSLLQELAGIFSFVFKHKAQNLENKKWTLSPAWKQLKVVSEPFINDTDKSVYFYNAQTYQLVKMLEQSAVDNRHMSDTPGVSRSYRVYVSQPKNHINPSSRARVMNELFGFQNSLDSLPQGAGVLSIKSKKALPKPQACASFTLTEHYLDQEWFAGTAPIISFSVPYQVPASSLEKMPIVQKGNFSNSAVMKTIEDLKRRRSNPSSPAPRHETLTNLSWPNMALLFNMFSSPDKLKPYLDISSVEERIFERQRADIYMLCVLDELLEIMKEDFPQNYYQIQNNDFLEIALPEDFKPAQAPRVDSKKSIDKNTISPILDAFIFPYASHNNFFFIKDDAVSWRGYSLGADQVLLSLKQLSEVGFDDTYINFQISLAKITRFDAEIVKCESSLIQELKANYDDSDITAHLEKRREKIAIETTKMLLESNTQEADSTSTRKTHKI